jgi:endonuclease-8
MGDPPVRWSDARAPDLGPGAHAPRLSRLGPDIGAPGFDAEKALARLSSDDPSRVGDALLDQRSLAGIGNLWKVEACWHARIDPWRALAHVRDDEILSILAEARPRMVDSATTGRQWRYKRIYGTAGRPCPRCGERIRVRRQGDAARPTWWCRGCQR